VKSGSPSQFGLTPAYVQYGTITDVHPERWTVTIRCSVGEREFFDCPIPSGYLHAAEGEGMHVMPEIGAQVLVCVPSEKDARPVILTYVPFTDAAGTMRARRPNLNPGDLVMLSRDGNGLAIRRGGVVEIQSTSIAKTLYLPITNEIRSICENWTVFSFGGSVEWKTFRAEEDAEGRKKTRYTMKMKEFADDVAHIAEISAGSKLSDGVLNIQTFKDGDVKEGSLQRSVSLVFRDDTTAVIESGDFDHKLDSGACVSIYNTKGNIEGVILGKTFFTDHLQFLTELQTGLLALGLTLPIIPTMIANVTLSIASPTGTAPYLSTRTKTE